LTQQVIAFEEALTVEFVKKPRSTDFLREDSNRDVDV
jgi:hypothetical protein